MFWVISTTCQSFSIVKPQGTKYVFRGHGVKSGYTPEQGDNLGRCETPDGHGDGGERLAILPFTAPLIFK